MGCTPKLEGHAVGLVGFVFSGTLWLQPMAAITARNPFGPFGRWPPNVHVRRRGAGVSKVGWYPITQTQEICNDKAIINHLQIYQWVVIIALLALPFRSTCVDEI